jgi:hypothetical protein
MPGPATPAAAHASLPSLYASKEQPRRRPRRCLSRRREGLYSHCGRPSQELFRAIFIS